MVCFKQFLIVAWVATALCGANLLDAVKAGDRAGALSLLKNRGAVNTSEADGTTPLHWAARSNDLVLVQALLRAGANAKASNRYGVTPLSLAVTNGSAAMAEVLLKAGANASFINGGETILMTAARAGNPDVMKALLGQTHLDVNARESAYGETALMWAAAENHGQAARLLIARGAEVNARSKLMTYPKDRFGLEGVLSVLPHGNWTALMYAARQGSVAAVRVLAEAGADVNLTDPDGTTALVLAIINQHYDAARLLVEKGADPNLADAAGMAALYATVDANTLGEIYGRPGRKTVNDSSALELMTALIKHGAKVNGRLKSTTLFRAHTPGEGTLGEGSTPLMRAARNGDAAALRLLLQNGADASLKQKNGTTALMLACGFGRGLGVFADDFATDAQMLESAKVLLDQNVDVNAVNENGQAALHYAALSLDNVVLLLAERGAVLEIKDKQGRTPLDFALGAGGRGRAGAAPRVREETAALLRQLMKERN